MILLIILFISFQDINNSLIEWKRERPLVVSDFKGKIQKKRKAYAATYSFVRYKVFKTKGFTT